MVAVALLAVVLAALVGVVATRGSWSSGRVRSWALVVLTLPAIVVGIVVAEQVTRWLGYDPAGPEDLPRGVEVLGAGVFVAVALSAPVAGAVVGLRAVRRDPGARAPMAAGVAVAALVLVVTVWLNR